MSKYAAFVLLISIRIFYHPSDVNASNPAFAHPVEKLFAIAIADARVISATANVVNNKVYLNWVVSQNETADKFEIEKSTDGKNFKMAALVFGTDKPETDKYEFYEKAQTQKYIYRIKLINKDKKEAYSPVFEISPSI